MEDAGGVLLQAPITPSVPANRLITSQRENEPAVGLSGAMNCTRGRSRTGNVLQFTKGSRLFTGLVSVACLLPFHSGPSVPDAPARTAGLGAAHSAASAGPPLDVPSAVAAGQECNAAPG